MQKPKEKTRADSKYVIWSKYPGEVRFSRTKQFDHNISKCKCHRLKKHEAKMCKLCTKLKNEKK